MIRGKRKRICDCLRHNKVNKINREKRGYTKNKTQWKTTDDCGFLIVQNNTTFKTVLYFRKVLVLLVVVFVLFHLSG